MSCIGLQFFCVYVLLQTIFRGWARLKTPTGVGRVPWTRKAEGRRPTRGRVAWDLWWLEFVVAGHTRTVIQILMTARRSLKGGEQSWCEVQKVICPCTMSSRIGCSRQLSMIEFMRRKKGVEQWTLKYCSSTTEHAAFFCRNQGSGSDGCRLGE